MYLRYCTGCLRTKVSLALATCYGSSRLDYTLSVTVSRLVHTVYLQLATCIVVRTVRKYDVVLHRDPSMESVDHAQKSRIAKPKSQRGFAGAFQIPSRREYCLRTEPQARAGVTIFWGETEQDARSVGQTSSRRSPFGPSSPTATVSYDKYSFS